jgi:transposase
MQFAALPPGDYSPSLRSPGSQREFDQDIADIEKRLRLWKKDQEAVKRLLAIPGAGLLTATAIVATVGDMKSF